MQHNPVGDRVSHRPEDPRDKLLGILKYASNHNELVTVLISGPSGSGKSTLAIQTAKEAGFKVIRFRPKDLSSDEAGAVEAAVCEAFQALVARKLNLIGTAEDDIISPPTAVILDDLEFWAPAESTSPIDLRVIAVLADELTALKEGGISSGAVIATSTRTHAVHEALISSNLFTYQLSLHALPVHKRVKLSEQWLQEKFGRGEHDRDIDSAASVFADVTPGFMHVDMQEMFSLLEEPGGFVAEGNSYKTGGELVDSSFFHTVLDRVTPSLLKSVPKGSKSMDLRNEDEIPLYGLDRQIQLLRDCLLSVFLIPDAPPNSPLAATIAALSEIGYMRGMIFHGPSGSGKSALTKLASDMIPRNTVNFLHTDSTSIVSSVIGEAERNVSTLFAVARAIAPTVLVIDNIDILAPTRDAANLEHSSSSAAETFNRILSTLLTEIDGVKEHTEGPPVFILATTRSLDLVDSALLRPGRIEMHVSVDLPDAEARIKVLQHCLRKIDDVIPNEAEREMHDFELFKNVTEGWTAPDILAVAREIAMARLSAHRDESHVTQQQDLLSAFVRLNINNRDAELDDEE